MINRMMKGFLLCIQFFTVIPYRKELPWERVTIEWCLRFFPIVGLLIGFVGWLQVWVLTAYTPLSTLFITFWLLFYFIAITGGLHIDGWMDCSDAFFSYRSKEKRLQIMEDPRVGSFAVLSVLFLLGFRFLIIYELVTQSLAYVLLGVLIIPILSRAMVVGMLVMGKLAKDTGLAASFQREVRAPIVKMVVLLTILLVGYLAFLLGSVWCSIVLLMASLVFYLLFYTFCKQQFGGINGDTLGALLEGGETFLWFILWLLPYFVMD
jgi:adenosylcobinamide-GDP ribazoletransferase